MCNDVKQATEHLLSFALAQQAKTYIVEKHNIYTEIHSFKGIAEVLAEREEMIRIEKELQIVFRKLELVYQEQNNQIC